jgi:hypothetical protein
MDKPNPLGYPREKPDEELEPMIETLITTVKDKRMLYLIFTRLLMGMRWIWHPN